MDEPMYLEHYIPAIIDGEHVAMKRHTDGIYRQEFIVGGWNTARRTRRIARLLNDGLKEQRRAARRKNRG